MTLRSFVRRRSRLRLAAVLAVAPALASCTGGLLDGRPAAVPAADTVVVASFNFPESVLLGEIYSQALELAGIPVRRELDLGPRELVLPALRQGRVDLVPEYLGTALEAVDPGASVGGEDGAAVLSRLTRALAPAELTPLRPAAAQDQNGFAVRSDVARRSSLASLSDLARIRRPIALAGPFECRTRPHCLPGLERVYGIEVAAFLPYDTEEQRVAALEQGLADVAVVFTTDGRLAAGGLTLLADDRGLQPVENIVPVVSERARRAHGDVLVDRLNEVSAALTTRGLVFLNWRLSVAGKRASDEAAAWLQRHDIGVGIGDGVGVGIGRRP